MDLLFLISGAIGFGPALFIIWFSMRKYSYPYLEGSAFEDRKVFFLLAVGMVFGTLIFTFERMLHPYFYWDEGVDMVMFLLIYVLGFVMLEDMAKFVVLNFKGFEGRFDSVFYGISLSAGYSATAMVGYIYIGVGQAEVSPPFIDWLGLILLSISSAFIHTSVGALLGNATAKKQGLRGIPAAVVPHIIFSLLMLPWFLGFTWISLAFTVPLSILIYRGVHLHTIPEILPEEIIKELRRSERKDSSRRRQ